MTFQSPTTATPVRKKRLLMQAAECCAGVFVYSVVRKESCGARFRSFKGSCRLPVRHYFWLSYVVFRGYFLCTVVRGVVVLDRCRHLTLGHAPDP